MELSNKISAATLARTAVLLLALTNQVLSAMGKPVLPIESTTVEQLVTAGITTVAALINWWKNNRGQGPRRRRFPGAFFRLQQGGRRNSSRFFARNSVPQKVVFRNNPHTLHQYRNRIISRPQQFLFFLQQILVICAKYPIQTLEYFHKSCVSTYFFLTTCTRKWYKGSRIVILEICPSYGTVVMRKRLDTI